MKKNKSKNISRWIFILVGLIILGLLFKTFGVKKTFDDIMRIGWRFGIICILFIPSQILLSYGWALLINHKIRIRDFYKVVFARIVGDATSSINSLAAIAGEPLKAMYIKEVVPLQTGLASVVLDRTAHMIGNTLNILTGILIALLILDIPKYIFAIAFGLIFLVFAMLFFVIQKQKEGFLDFLINLLPKKFRLKMMTESRKEKVNKLDIEIKYIFSTKKRKLRFFASAMIHYLTVFIFCSLEIFLIVKFLGFDLTLLDSAFLYVFGLFISSVVFFMPVGPLEGSYPIALSMMGMDPAMGLTIGIVRRLRTFVWAGFGMLLMFQQGFSVKQKPGKKD